MREKSKGKKSITINAILNMFNTTLTMSFALITYPYVSRVLQVENLGKVNYSASIVSYFALIAALGFNTYAIREGGKIRNDSKSFTTLANEIFTFNFITVLIAYIILAIVTLLVPKFHPYVMLLAIQSVTMISAWIGVNWVNVVFEDYLFITIRSITVQILSLIAMFLFVKKTEDYYVYASISISAHFFVSIINFFYVQRYIKIRFVRKINALNHIKPILVFFSNTLAVSVYLNSDTTMIGWILGNYDVGLYSVSVKIYSTIRNLIAAVYNVAVSRMSLYSVEEDLKNFKLLLNRIINTVILISLPMTAGLVILSRRLIMLLSGESYILATKSLQILAFAFLFAVLGGVLAYCVDIPLRKENNVLYATVISAVENIGLNVILIPLYGINGAAFTTFLAEVTVFCVLLSGLRKAFNLFNFREIALNMGKCIVSILPFFPLYYFLNSIRLNNISVIVIYFVLTTSFYFIIQLLLKNKTLKDFIRNILQKKII